MYLAALDNFSVGILIIHNKEYLELHLYHGVLGVP